MKRRFSILPLLCLTATAASSQELEPRAYAITPVNSNAVTVTYLYASGEASFDPTLPLDDVRARTHGLAAGYYRSFGLFGRSANFLVAQPYAASNIDGSGPWALSAPDSRAKVVAVVIYP